MPYVVSACVFTRTKPGPEDEETKLQAIEAMAQNVADGAACLQLVYYIYVTTCHSNKMYR